MNFTDKVVLTRKINDEISPRTDINQRKLDWSQELVISENDTSTKKLRKYIFNTLTDPEFGPYAKAYGICLSLIVVGSILEFSLATVYSLNYLYDQKVLLNEFELLFNIIFSMDYFSKILFCPNLFKLPRLLISPSWLIDLCSIIPFYIELASDGTTDASVLRVMRIVRIFRIFRILKASKNIRTVKMVFTAISVSKEAFVMLLFMVANVCLFFGSFIFYAESNISSFDFDRGLWIYTSGTLAGSVSQFQSIPHTLWFCAATLTTVGYGDMVTMSPLGKILASVTALVGILVVAYPVTILSSNMGEIYKEDRLTKESRSMKKKFKQQKISLLRFNADKIALIEMINLDLIRNDNKLKIMQNSISNMLDDQDDINLCSMVLQDQLKQNYSSI